MKTVYVVIEAKSEDYHGTYREIVSIYANKDTAMKKVNQLIEENYNCDTEYYYETYNVIS